MWRSHAQVKDPLTGQGHFHKLRSWSWVKVSFTCQSPDERWRSFTCGGLVLFNMDVSFTGGVPVHTEYPFTCTCLAHTWRTHSHMEVFLSHGVPIHRWRSCSHMEYPFTGEGLLLLSHGVPINKWRACSHMEYTFTCGGISLTWSTHS